MKEQRYTASEQFLSVTRLSGLQMIEVVANGVPKEDIMEFIPLPQNCQNWTEQLMQTMLLI